MKANSRRYQINVCKQITFLEIRSPVKLLFKCLKAVFNVKWFNYEIRHEVHIFTLSIVFFAIIPRASAEYEL